MNNQAFTANIETPLLKAAAGAEDSFHSVLEGKGLALTRDECSTLQINVGYLCNQSCRHCHLEAGPGRGEVMTRHTAAQVVAFAANHRFQTADITGGAVEMCPELGYLLENLRPLVDTLIVRSNLTAAGARLPLFIELFRENRAVVIASLPSPNLGQTDSQRGQGVFERCIKAVQALNMAGYGVKGSGLELHFVSNPSGAILPVAQEKAEARFRASLQKKYGVEFNNLYTFVNAPIGRFRQWLWDSGNYTEYLGKLKEGFNPCAVNGVMCRTLLSVGWDGYLYDCDFNQAAGLGLGGKKTHITEIKEPPLPGSAIAVGDHCFSCVAGSGFT